MSTRNVLIALTGAAVTIAAPACGTSSTPHQTAPNSPSPTTTLASTPAATSQQSVCADLGGTVGANQTCHIHSTTPTYTLNTSFPLDYPDQTALTDVVRQDRDSFVDWVADVGSHGR